MAVFLRAASALACCLMLGACLVTPGKFESTLDIRADRQFSFTYKGEIILSDMKGLGSSVGSIGEGAPKKKDSALHKTAMQKGREDGFGEGGGSGDEAQMQAIAAALSKEKGFRSARYMGNHRFEIDYAISGRLTH
ncbi:MAG TPA: hypothetical protein VN110_00715, partial [Sphingobium sp.]|nr:hypothetical protein [Sphingobium sp.]